MSVKPVSQSLPSSIKPYDELDRIEKSCEEMDAFLACMEARDKLIEGRDRLIDARANGAKDEPAIANELRARLTKFKEKQQAHLSIKAAYERIYGPLFPPAKEDEMDKGKPPQLVRVLGVGRELPEQYQSHSVDSSYDSHLADGVRERMLQQQPARVVPMTMMLG